MPSASRRTELIWFERATITEDEHGGEILTWPGTYFATRRARVRFGTSQEKREAAQETATQTATFECVRSSTLLNVTMKDRIIYMGRAWDIVENAPLDTATIRFTATRVW